MASAGQFITIPCEAFFGVRGAILRNYSPWYEYTKNPETHESERNKNPSGMKATVISPHMAFEHITVKIRGTKDDLDVSKLDTRDLEDSFRSGNYIFVEFDDFAGSSYTKDGGTHYTAMATRIYRLPQAEQQTQAAKK